MTHAEGKLILYGSLIGSRYRREPSSAAPEGIPAIPYTVEETLADVDVLYHEQGVRFFHVHSRGEHGEHVSRPQWYQQFARAMQDRYPDAAFCFATSGAYEVQQQVEDWERRMRLVRTMGEEDVAICSQMARAQCLATDRPHELPHFITTFTAAEVMMEHEQAEIGPVTQRQPAAVVRGFYDMVTKKARDKGVGQEIEITTAESMEVVENLHARGALHGPLSFIIQPDFNPSFPYDEEQLSDLAARAQWLIRQNGGKGIVVLERTSFPDTEDTLAKREESIRFALANPDIQGLRLGIEGAPCWDRSPSSNPELAANTAAFIRELGGEIVSDPAAIAAMTGIDPRAPRIVTANAR